MENHLITHNQETILQSHLFFSFLSIISLLPYSSSLRFLISNHVHHHESRHRFPRSRSCSSSSSVPGLPVSSCHKCHFSCASSCHCQPGFSLRRPFHRTYGNQALPETAYPGTNSFHGRCVEEDGRLHLRQQHTSSSWCQRWRRCFSREFNHSEFMSPLLKPSSEH